MATKDAPKQKQSTPAELPSAKDLMKRIALKEAESIRAEAGLPKNKSITATGTLSNYLKADIGHPILSESAGSGGRWWWIAVAAIVVINLVAWLMK